MRVETLSIGTELVAGNIIDTNAGWLAQALRPLGLTVDRHTALPDELASLVAYLRDFRRRADGPVCLLATGGLGPTLDDLTREAVAEAFDAPLAENADCRRDIEEMFRSRGWNMAASNLRQARIPAGADPLHNSCGTAPGFHLAAGGLHVLVMPGVPAEMRVMFASGVLPVLRTLVPPGRVVAERMIRTFGLGESSLGQAIADLMAAGRKSEVGTLASEGLVTVRVRVVADSEREARELLDRDETEVRRRLGEVVIGCDGDLLPDTVVRLLRQAGSTLAVAESCTGGLIAKLVTDVSGASDVFTEGLVTYANTAKVARLGVPAELIAAHGAVSEPVARAMAEGARTSSGTAYALAATGIAGPTGGSPDKPVGLVFLALAGLEGTEVTRLVLPGDRDRVRHRAAMAALNLLRLRLLRRTT